MSRKSSLFEAASTDGRYEVIGEDDCIYLSKEDRYVKHGEVIALSDETAQMLIAGNLVKKVETTPATINQLDKE
jgi:hypothetical protein